MELPLISVIVPIYNVQNELSRCIDSIIKQSYQKMELILVDDGSTDGSLEICQRYANKDKRIKVYSKVNGGLSDARNFGLKYAVGDYVAFIDSDDYVGSSYLEKLYTSVTDKKTDVAVCAFSKVDINGDLEEIVHFPSELDGDEISGRELLKLVFAKDGYTFVVAWNKLYKRKLFNNVQFEKGKLHEDEFINFPLFWNVKRVSIVNESLYNYVQRTGSITNSKYSQRRFDSLFEFHQRRIDFYKRHNATELYRLANQAFRNWCVTFVLEHKKEMSSQDLWKIQVAFRKSRSLAPSHQGLKLFIQDISGMIDIRLAAGIKKIVYR
ncbi:glycosyltransferase [Ligilactobacillus saerimneri]|uniref:glycosyltransferase n=1 Tax=Ligilactobacillus saerimneri TaxID=228229 RepID=UPI0022A6F360|nr:glycosyltransferase [Ligilactobacillus saerimneri]MCZ0891368.1 glycosyltransferase [Ligilactobacillus saerimneri]MDI9206543.1 glycosyltransferase [Ligilactobacillus saerimneri]